MKTSILFGVLFSLCAAGAGKKVYKIAGEGKIFFQKEGVYVSVSCQNKCLALKKLKKLKERVKTGSGLPNVEKSLYLKSVASVACENMGGKSVFGADPRKNMMAFCRFSDDSLIEYASLEAMFGEVP